MSAFMCSDTHINAMVTAALVYDHYNKRSGQELGELLFKANQDSLVARYDDDPAKWPDYSGYRQVNKTQVEVLKACACFDYQACEVENYDQTEAAKLVRHIRNDVISSLPGYEEAPWGVD